MRVVANEVIGGGRRGTEGGGRGRWRSREEMERRWVREGARCPSVFAAWIANTLGPRRVLQCNGPLSGLLSPRTVFLLTQEERH